MKFIEVKETDNTSNCLTLHDFCKFSYRFLNTKSQTTKILNSLLFTVGTRSSRRAILISFSLVYFPQLSGIYILLSYTTAFFSEAGSSLTPLQSSIVICVVQLIAGGLSTVLVDRLGRKVILIVSSVGCGFGTCLLAVILLSSKNIRLSNLFKFNFLKLNQSFRFTECTKMNCQEPTGFQCMAWLSQYSWPQWEFSLFHM